MKPLSPLGTLPVNRDSSLSRSCATDLLYLPLYVFGVLHVLRSLGASHRLLVLSALFCVGVAAGRRAFWRGRRPGLAAVATGGAMGLLTTCYLVYPLCHLRWQFWMALGYSRSYAAQFVLQLILVSPALGALAYIEHVALSACGYAGRIIFSLYCACRGGERINPRLKGGELKHLGVYLAMLLLLGLLYRPLEEQVCLRAARDFIGRAMSGGPPPFPVEALLMRLQYGSFPSPESEWADCLMRAYEACRDRLVASGQLIHRAFRFEHVEDGTDEAWAVIRAAYRVFPDNVYTTVQHGPGGTPLVIEVYAPPDEIPRWEAFVREHDVQRVDKREPQAPVEQVPRA